MVNLVGSDPFAPLVVGRVLGRGGSVEIGEGEVIKDREESGVFV